MRLSNEFSEKPIEIRSVWVADARDSSDVDRKTARSLYFGEKKAVTIEPGKTVTSDALAYGLKPLQLLAITISYGRCRPRPRGTGARVPRRMSLRVRAGPGALSTGHCAWSGGSTSQLWR